jgi:hypothetical protein
MSTRTKIPSTRVPLVLVVVASLLAPAMATAGSSGAGVAEPMAFSASVLAPVGQATPRLLGPGAPSGGRRVLAHPFRTLDPGALRAAKLLAAAIASRGSRGPSTVMALPLAGLFNNLDAPGLSDSSVAPPDSTGAIGPNNYVEMVNQQIGVYDRSLNLLSSSADGTFVGAGTNLSVSDPQLQWDGRGGRWLYAAVGIATGGNVLLFGWSKTSDPSDLSNGWCRFGIQRGSSLDDYPKLGHDDNFISIGANVYNDSIGYAFLTANIFAIPKPAAGDTSCAVGSATYYADATHVLHNADASVAFTPVPANTADASALGYIVAAHSPVDGTGSSAPKVMVWHLALLSGSPSLVSDGDVAISSFAVPAPVPQPGTSFTLDTLDARLTQAVAVNDPSAGGAKGIWTQHTVAGASGRSVVRWYEIMGGSPPTLRQQGEVSSTTDFVFNGAVSPSIGGASAAVFYNRGGSATLPLIAAQTRSGSTPLGNLDAGELLLGQSSAADQDFTCTSTAPCRWGDYAGASPDPNNAGVVWGSNQLTGGCVILCGFFAQWQTRNFAVVAAPPPSASPPGAPILSVPSAGNGTVGLSWSAPSSDGGAPITDYAVYRGTASRSEVFLAKTGGPLTYTDTGLTNGATYWYTVAAINSAGTGAQSNERSATPVAPPPAPDFKVTVAPTARTVMRGSSTTYSVTLTGLNGFAGSVSLTSIISPSTSRVTRTFSPTSVSLTAGVPSGASTLTVATTGRTSRTTYTITITATSGTRVHKTTVTLTVA